MTGWSGWIAKRFYKLFPVIGIDATVLANVMIGVGMNGYSTPILSNREMRMLAHSPNRVEFGNHSGATQRSEGHPAPRAFFQTLLTYKAHPRYQISYAAPCGRHFHFTPVIAKSAATKQSPDIMQYSRDRCVAALLATTSRLSRNAAKATPARLPKSENHEVKFLNPRISHPISITEPTQTFCERHQWSEQAYHQNTVLKQLPFSVIESPVFL